MMPESVGGIRLILEDEDLTCFENKSGLSEDLKFLASMPELCDVTFLVGDKKEPVCGVRAVLAARSRVFYQLLYRQPSPPPTKKKETQMKENKLKTFLKRSSEPAISIQNTAQTIPTSTFPIKLLPHHTLTITEFEPDVFRQMVEYIHTGCVTLQPRTLLGVMNAADLYGLDELRKACHGFIQSCINVDTVCALLQTADRYIQYKCTKSFIKQVLEFIDERGNEILNLGSFALLPLHVVRLIFSRKQLVADEFTKFQAALMWTMKYSDLHKDVEWKTIFRDNFLNCIRYHKIPANVLMKEIDPLKVVPNEMIVTALAYQADPTCIDPNVTAAAGVTVVAAAAAAAGTTPSPTEKHAKNGMPGKNPSVPSLELPYASNTTLNSAASSEHLNFSGSRGSGNNNNGSGGGNRKNGNGNGSSGCVSGNFNYQVSKNSTI